MLQITGRDLLETPELAMEFKDGFWTARGDAATTVLNPAHQALIDTLRTAGYPMTPTQLATVLGANLNTTKVHLMRLTERGLVWKDGQGHYAPRIMGPERAESVTHCNPRTPVPPPPVVEEPDTSALAAASGSGVEHGGEQTTPFLETPGRADDTSTAVGATVTPVTPDVSQAQTPMRPATNGHSNGHAVLPTNGQHHDAGAQQDRRGLDPVCPQCGKPACQPFAGTGRVCMQCGYCERP